MRKKQKVIHALTTMDTMFADYPLTELEYTNPFQLLTAVMLSAQTTDKQVNKVTKDFFKVVQGPKDVLKLGESGVKEYIKTVGLNVSKTKNLLKTAQILVDKTTSIGPYSHKQGNSAIRTQQMQYKDSEAVYAQWGYYIPDSIQSMTQLAGVGIKTAKVVLYILYGQKRVAVDTHVHRVMNRLGIVATKTPDQTSKLLETIIPDEYKDIAHRVIIYFGRYHCIARKPKCESCPLIDICPFGKKELKKKL